MKAFAEFYRPSTGYVAGSIPPRFDGPKTPIPACGSDSVLVLDGRWSRARMLAEARTVCRARQFVGFRVYRGGRFTEPGRELTKGLQTLA